MSYRDYVSNYRSSRGMDFYHDVHDWLGGYPYETALAPEVDREWLSWVFGPNACSLALSVGLLGSGCDEYVYRRQAA